MADEPKKLGRPSKFSDALCEKILALADKGKTDKQIAEAIGVTERTLGYWKVKNPDFFQALKEAKGVADELVVASLFQRATGYSHEAVQMFYDKDLGKVIKEKYTKHYPPDVTAMIYWLKNRQPDQWRDAPEKGTGDDELPTPLYAVVTDKPDKTTA